MARAIARREFLRTASAAAGALAFVARQPVDAAGVQASDSVRISSVGYTPVADYPIRATRHADVRMKDAFWAPKIATNATVTIPFEVQKLTEGGRALSGNVLEAAMLSLATHPDAKLQSTVDASVSALAARPERGNGMFEAAATYFRATGRRDLLDPAIKTAAALYDDFKTRNPPFSGGERDAITCIQLYRVTGDKTHLDLAKHYLDIRGLENSVNRSRHNQSYKPVLEQSEAVGHAVNCASLMVSLADVGVLTGLHEYFDAAQRMWTDAATRKMYITGGIGSTGNEGFGEPYDLPNISAYSETCAVLMFVTFNHHLFLATGDSKYIDVMERGMYNNAIDGVSLSGDRFFYVNRLASAGDGRDARWARASLECCPPNLVRFLAQMPGFMYAQDKSDAIYVNLYATSETSLAVGAKRMGLAVDSEMPWGGKTSVRISTPEPLTTTLKLRMPGWTRNQVSPGDLYRYLTPLDREPTVSINGRPVSATPDRFGYVSIDRAWTSGDVVEIEFPMAVRRVVADDRVRANNGRMAIERGPIVYCLEWPEADAGRVLDRLIDGNVFTPAVDASRGGVTVIRGEARALTNPTRAATPITLIPYYQWANRAAGEMSVWHSRVGYKVGDTGPAGGLIFYENPNYAADGWRYLEAAPVDQSAGAKWGCFRTPIQGARGTAIGTGRQNTKDMLAASCEGNGTAAELCANYSLNGVRGWYLPSRDELAEMYRALKATRLGDFGVSGVTDNFSYWSSSQQTTDMAAHIDFADNGRQHSDDKDFPRRVRAIRTV